MFVKGDRVTTPRGHGTIVYARMAPPDYSAVEVYSVRLDWEHRLNYVGTIYGPSDVKAEIKKQ